MVKLKVRANYQNANTVYLAGSIIEVTEEEAEQLMRDSPGSFGRAPARSVAGGDELAVSQPDPYGSGFELPPVDKMLRKGKTK